MNRSRFPSRRLCRPLHAGRPAAQCRIAVPVGALELPRLCGVPHRRGNLTDVVVNTLVSAASGSGSRAAQATAALETCASTWARALAAADVAPVTVVFGGCSGGVPGGR